jgi:hypothetical protein
MQESSLHAALKDWYAQPGDQQEVSIDGYLVDIVRDNLLIEIQTRNFNALKDKLSNLLERHPVRLVHPIAREKWILRLPGAGGIPKSRRKSPRRGRLEHLFLEMVRIPHLVANPSFSLEVLITREEEIRRDDGKGSWRRRGQSIVDRRLIDVIDNHLFASPTDYMSLIPADLPHPFTNQDLATELNIPRYLAAKMTYCLRSMQVLDIIGKRGRWLLYDTSTPAYNPDL